LASVNNGKTPYIRGEDWLEINAIMYTIPYIEMEENPKYKMCCGFGVQGPAVMIYLYLGVVLRPSLIPGV
jgi:hypothetical protein